MISDETRDARTTRMRALGEDERRDAISAASNVVGFDRFQQRRKQVDLRAAYRKPQSPAPGGKA